MCSLWIHRFEIKNMRFVFLSVYIDATTFIACIDFETEIVEQLFYRRLVNSQVPLA